MAFLERPLQTSPLDVGGRWRDFVPQRFAVAWTHPSAKAESGKPKAEKITASCSSAVRLPPFAFRVSSSPLPAGFSMNRALCQVFAAGLLLAGCQSSPFQTAKKNPTDRPLEGTGSDKGASPWLDGNSMRFRHSRAVADARDSRRGSGKQVDSDLKLAHAALRAGRLDEAKSLYQLVLRGDPRNASAHHRLATIADQQRDFRAASQHYAVALQQRPHDAALLSDVGWSSFLQRRYAESEHYLNQAVKIDPKNTKALYNLGWLYGVQQRPKLAYRMFLQGGSPATAEKMMARLERSLELERERMLADNSPTSRRPSDVRAPDPNASRRYGTDDRHRTDARDINYALRQRMDRARERDLALRDRDDRGYRPGSPDSRYSPRGRADGRYSDARTMPRDFRSGDDDRRFEQDRGTPREQDTRLVIRPRNGRNLNDEMRRIDGLHDPRRGGPPADSGTKQTGYDGAKGRNLRQAEYDRRAAGGPDSGPIDRGLNSRSTGDIDMWPPADGVRSARRGTIRNADSQRVLPNGDDRRPTSASVDPLHREALRLGHNTGAGGVPFPIPNNGSRTERTLPTPGRGRPSTDARGPSAPTPWRGDDRDSGTGNGTWPPRDAAGRGYAPANTDDGPAIRPRARGANGGAGPPDLTDYSRRDSTRMPGGGFSEPSGR
jgi:Tfp pilus assembly protein PilF